MTGSEMRNVLHVLPHPGGGGETYVDALSKLDIYRAERMYLAPSTSPFQATPVLVPNAIGAHLKATRMQVVHAHGEIAAAFLLPALGRMPSVVTLHGLHFLRRARGARYRLAKLNLRAISARAGRVICVSQSEFEDVASFLPAQAMERFVVIPNGVVVPPLPTAPDREATRAELGLPPDVAVALYVGKLDDVKEPLVAVRATVDACRHGARLVLLVAGDGPLRSAVRAEGGEHVRVLGFRRDVGRLHSVADVFVLPSRREGLSYALLEAMAYGATPVVTDIPCNVEAVGKRGVVLPAGDVAAFAGALARLVEDPDTLDLLGTQARERVEREFREDVMLAQTGAEYDAVVEERGRRRREPS